MYHCICVNPLTVTTKKIGNSNFKTTFQKFIDVSEWLMNCLWNLFFLNIIQVIDRRIFVTDGIFAEHHAVFLFSFQMCLFCMNNWFLAFN